MTGLLVFWGWPVVAFILFRRVSLAAAVAWTVIGGYLILPNHISINLPVLPKIDRNMIATGSALLFASLFLAQQAGAARLKSATPVFGDVRPGWIPQDRIVQILLIILVGGAAMTAMTNFDRVNEGGKILPGLGVYDIFSNGLNALVTLIPLLVARKFLASEEGHRTLLTVLSIAGLIYSLPTLYEVRMSPQLDRIIYGTDGHAWVQNLRGDGFRPVVFLGHGLMVGVFVTAAVLATVGCLRAAPPERKILYFGIFIWLFATLVLVKSFGALLIAVALLPVALFFPVRLQLVVAAGFAILILSYPVLRGAGLVPVNTIVSMVAKIDESRSRSLNYRIANEDILLEKAVQRPLFGWAGWGRSRVYDERGRDVSTTDGHWVITLGLGGWTRYLAVYGLLTIGVLLLAFRKKDYEVSIVTSALCLVLVSNLIDLIPNTGLTIVTWSIAGALIGRLEMKGAAHAQAPPADVAVDPQRIRYARNHTDPDMVRHHPVNRRELQ